MPVSRHFEIVYMLLHKKTVTARELADRFEVSSRTIYRDIESLSAAGIPVYSSRGKGGGISLLEGYVFNSSLLSEREDILMGLQSLSAARLPEVEDVLGKLSRMFKKDAGSWIEADFSPWGSGDSGRRLFPLLKRAIAARRVITFRYYNSAGEASERSVEPARLLFKNRAWYLTGYCLGSLGCRTFKISRMKETAVTEAECQVRPPEPADWEEPDTKPDITVHLKISAEGAYRVYDEFAEESVTRCEDGTFSITARLEEGNWLYGYLLSFGPLLLEVGPDSLSQKIVHHLDAMRQNLNAHPATGMEPAS